MCVSLALFMCIYTYVDICMYTYTHICLCFCVSSCLYPYLTFFHSHVLFIVTFISSPIPLPMITHTHIQSLIDSFMYLLSCWYWYLCFYICHASRHQCVSTFIYVHIFTLTYLKRWRPKCTTTLLQGPRNTTQRSQIQANHGQLSMRSCKPCTKP